VKRCELSASHTYCRTWSVSRVVTSRVATPRRATRHRSTRSARTGLQVDRERVLAVHERPAVRHDLTVVVRPAAARADTGRAKVVAAPGKCAGEDRDDREVGAPARRSPCAIGSSAAVCPPIGRHGTSSRLIAATNASCSAVSTARSQ
jgi:hypothetical protein